MRTYVMQLVLERQYTTIVVFLAAALAFGYLLGKVLEMVNACYHGRKKNRNQ